LIRGKIIGSRVVRAVGIIVTAGTDGVVVRDVAIIVTAGANGAGVTGWVGMITGVTVGAVVITAVSLGAGIMLDFIFLKGGSSGYDTVGVMYFDTRCISAAVKGVSGCLKRPIIIELVRRCLTPVDSPAAGC
jgi:hypothetical protein